jgi:hypothetical protein
VNAVEYAFNIEGYEREDSPLSLYLVDLLDQHVQYLLG